MKAYGASDLGSTLTRGQAAGILAALISVIFLTQRFWHLRRRPSAPGSKLARFTNGWYIWKINQGKFHEWSIERHTRLGKILRIGPNMYSIDDPEAVKTIYGPGSKMPKSDWYLPWGDMRVKNHNLFTIQDKGFHGKMRRKVAHLYSMSAVKSYEPFVDKCNATLLGKLDDIAAAGGRLDLQRWMQCYAFDTIGEITFGTNPGFMKSGAQDIDGAMDALEKSAAFCSILGVQFSLLPFLLMIYGNSLGKIGKFFETLEHGNRTKGGDISTQAETFSSKIDKLRDKEGMDFETYRVGVFPLTNITTGSDTTSISLTSILYHLAKDKRVFRKLKEEINEAKRNANTDMPMSFEESQKLPYLQLVIKEGMRMHAAVGLPMWRVVQEPGAAIAGCWFPPGTIVGINPWVAHYNTKVFGNDASVFRPERWSSLQTPAARLSLMEQYYLPFGSGSHTCIGKNISLLEMTKLIPELVYRYDFESASSDQGSIDHWFVKQKSVEVLITRTATVR